MAGSVAAVALAVGGATGAVGFGLGPTIDNTLGITSYKEYNSAYNHCQVGDYSFSWDLCEKGIEKLPDVYEYSTEAVEKLKEARGSSEAAAEKGYAVAAGGVGGGAAAVAGAKKRKQ